MVLAIIAIVAIAGNIYFLLERNVSQTSQASAPKQAPILEKFKVSVQSMNPESVNNIVITTGRELGIWTKNGLDPEWVSIRNQNVLAPQIKEHVTSGIEIGVNISTEVLLAQANGAPIKTVAGWIGAPNQANLYVKGDSPIRSVKDLDGKRIGVNTANDISSRFVLLLADKYPIKPEMVVVGNLTNNVVALKVGRTDAFVAALISVLRLVDSGELRILISFSEVYPTPFVSNVVWASEDVVQKNHALVKKFVEAWLETVGHVKKDKAYTTDLYVRLTNAPKELAQKVSVVIDWSPSGQGSGNDLMQAVSNVWQNNKQYGGLPASANIRIEDAVDIRFLP